MTAEEKLALLDKYEAARADDTGDIQEGFNFDKTASVSRRNKA